jgi:hypothetical protein
LGRILYKILYKVTLFLPQIADESGNSNDNYSNHDNYVKYVNVALRQQQTPGSLTIHRVKDRLRINHKKTP